MTEAVLAVLAAKPTSPVGLLTDGTVPLTAFIPNDRAFQVLAYDLTKRWPTTEEKTFTALVAAVGVDAIEQVLLYHVVPGAAITKKAAVNANGATLTTAQGGTIGVRVYNKYLPIVELRDKDTNDVNPFLNPRALDINTGNAADRARHRLRPPSPRPLSREPGRRGRDHDRARGGRPRGGHPARWCRPGRTRKHEGRGPTYRGAGEHR